MSDSRPSLVSKRTHVRAQKHDATFPADLPAPPRTLDSIIVGVGYIGLGAYMYHNLKKFTPWEITGISAGSLALGYSLYDLGCRNGMIEGTSFALRRNEDISNNLDDSESWKGRFRGQEFDDLKVAEKISWLRNEEKRIKDLQEDEQLKCGQAYIAKEEAYVAYERKGGYGGEDWKNYSNADSECQEMYETYEEQQKRLREIWKEIRELNALL